MDFCKLTKEKIGDFISYKVSTILVLGVFVYSFFSRNSIYDYFLILLISMIILWNAITNVQRIKFVLTNHDNYNIISTIVNWKNDRSYNPLLIISVYGLYITELNYLYYFGLVFISAVTIIQLLYYYKVESDWTLVKVWLLCSCIILSNLWSFKLGTTEKGLFERQSYTTSSKLHVLKPETFRMINAEIEQIQLTKLDSHEYIRNYIDDQILRAKKIKKNILVANCNVLIQHKKHELSSYVLDPIFLGLFIFTRSNQKSKAKLTLLNLKLPGNQKEYEIDTCINIVKKNHNYYDDDFFIIKTTHRDSFIGLDGSLYWANN